AHLRDVGRALDLGGTAGHTTPEHQDGDDGAEGHSCVFWPTAPVVGKSFLPDPANAPATGEPMRSGYGFALVSSMILPARSTLTLNGVPGDRPASLRRTCSMFSSETTGMSSTERMMSPPTARSRPPTVTIRSPPCRPMFHAVEFCATVLTRNPAGAG